MADLTGVVIFRSGGELTIEGRRSFRKIVVAALGVAAVVAMFHGIARMDRIAFGIIAAAALSLGVADALASFSFPTRLVLRPNGVRLTGFQFPRRYSVSGRVAELDVVGVQTMHPELETLPDRTPSYFLQIAVAGKTIRAFHDVPRAELDEVVSEIRSWRAAL